MNVQHEPPRLSTKIGLDSLRLEAVDLSGRPLPPGVYLVRLSPMNSHIAVTTQIVLQR
jgi:hypothetical protein